MLTKAKLIAAAVKNIVKTLYCAIFLQFNIFYFNRFYNVINSFYGKAFISCLCNLLMLLCAYSETLVAKHKIAEISYMKTYHILNLHVFWTENRNSRYLIHG